MEKIEKIIEIKNVSKQYDGITVVDDINLSIKKEEFVTLLGPSGCGKTTTLRMIAGFETPTSGRIFLNGRDVTDTPPHLREVNTVFQRYALFPHLNVYNNIAFGLKLKKIPDGFSEKKGKTIPLFRKFTKSEIDEKVNKALKMVGLDAYGRRDVNSLSGGQMQRVAIARALVNEPVVLLLDEPLGALDLKMRKEMQLELKSMHKNLGITFIYVTHDQEEALTLSDTVVVMRDGAIQQAGTPKKIYDEPANAYVADFIGQSNILSGVFIEDFKVDLLGHVIPCVDKGFAKGAKVDIVIRPEDIYVLEKHNPKGMIPGRVLTSIFKGAQYEMTVETAGYEFLVQDVNAFEAGAEVALFMAPDAIHIMKKPRTVNEFEAVVTAEGEVTFLETAFPCNTEGFEAGDEVLARIAFDKVKLTDDESDGIMGGNIADALYKGTYYAVQVSTEYDEDFFVDTPEEWDLNDRVGIRVEPEDISLEIKDKR
ncbi:MAG: ABC transporter ATP-binding protein [Clostridiales bacterium]|nr:ABC transporter ATP-binding protein [Clostridiales bacterium]